MNDLPLVSVVVLNFNGAPWLHQCFESLEKVHYPQDRLEVIMGDNASTDDSIDYTKNRFPWVRVLPLDRNYGFCKGNNLCAREATGEYLVFLNNDTFVAKDWLINLVLATRSDPAIVSSTGKILFPQFAGGRLINAAGGVIAPSGGGFYNGWMEEDSPVYALSACTGFGCGAGVLVQKKFFLESGGFDEYYFYSCEEMDLGFRAWLYGFKVLYVPSAVMYHYMGRTGFRGKGVTPSIEFLITRNNLYFILKNFQLLTAIKGLPLFLLKATAKMLYALAHGNTAIFAAIMKAHIHVFKGLKQILETRRATQRNRRVSDTQLLRMGVLVGVTEVVRRSYRVARNTRKYHFGSLYDTKDAVNIIIDEKGEFTFTKADNIEGNG